MFWLSILAGAACGVISGFGIGGGSLLMIWMTAAVHLEQRVAQGINLLYFLPTAAAAMIFHVRGRQIVWRAVIPAAIAGCISAALFSMLATRMDTHLLRKLFGGFLIATGLTEVFHKSKPKKR